MGKIIEICEDGKYELDVFKKRLEATIYECSEFYELTAAEVIGVLELIKCGIVKQLGVEDA